MQQEHIEELLKSKERSDKYGEVFTPQWLVDEMLDSYPEEAYADPELSFIDPTCGDGNFLVRVLERKVSNGISISQALANVYGIDILPDNVYACRKRLMLAAISLNDNRVDKTWSTLLRNNIRYGNVLERGIEEIFDEEDEIASKRMAIQSELQALDEENSILEAKVTENNEKKKLLLKQQQSLDTERQEQ